MRWRRALFVVAAGALVACASDASSGGDAPAGDAPEETAGSSPASSSDAPGAPSPGPAAAASPDGGCLEVTDAAPVTLATAAEAGEHALVVEASSESDTSWAKKDSEAVVLEIARGSELVGHLVLHQGKTTFAYAMHTGALAAGDVLTAKVSDLTAPNAEKKACISTVKLSADASEGVAHAPILKWPRQKSFDDLPVLVGWSKAHKSYQVTFTNENGGTCAICGGGAKGIRSEIARWARPLDMEGSWAYGGAGSFERCTGSVAPTAGTPRMEAEHPVLYYGDGHNRVFESRGGYGQACGTSGDKRPDGPFQGWNANNPGDEAAKDAPYTIVLRPLPVDLDAVGYATYGGRREAIVDTYAPWLYRLTWSELEREGKIDGSMTLPLDRYLFVDVYAADVGGSGDATCGFFGVSGGFKLRAVTSAGVVSDGPQMTKDYFGGDPGVKRIAIPLANGVDPKDIQKLVFDAYDSDGIYWLAVGDAFVAKPNGTNGATLEYVHQGKTAVNVYVDDDQSGCVAGKSTRDGVAYPCAGSTHTVVLP